MTAFTRIAASRGPTSQSSTRPRGSRRRSTTAGPEVSAEEVELFVDKLLYLAQGVDLRLAGSVPPGAWRTCTQLITELRALGVLTVLDTEGGADAPVSAPSPRWSRRT